MESFRCLWNIYIHSNKIQTLWSSSSQDTHVISVPLLHAIFLYFNDVIFFNDLINFMMQNFTQCWMKIIYAAKLYCVPDFLQGPVLASGKSTVYNIKRLDFHKEYYAFKVDFKIHSGVSFMFIKPLFGKFSNHR